VGVSVALGRGGGVCGAEWAFDITKGLGMVVGIWLMGARCICPCLACSCSQMRVGR
jgi:hypothetical protein